MEIKTMTKNLNPGICLLVVTEEKGKTYKGKVVQE